MFDTLSDMLKISDTVEEILKRDEEALAALSGGFMNLSGYAKRIHSLVEEQTKKEVEIGSIVVALSRAAKELTSSSPLVQDVELITITSKAPLTEIAYKKDPAVLEILLSIYKKTTSNNEDFFTLTLSSKDITVICSQRLKKDVLKSIKAKPTILTDNLASVGLSIDNKYYPLPNITYSLIRKIALKKIPLAETITTNQEIIFVFDQQYLSDIVQLYTENIKD